MTAKKPIFLILIVIVSALTISTSASAKDNWDQWKVLENDYFRMYTDASEKKARNLLEELEKFRLLAQASLKVKVPLSAPKTMVFLFKSGSKFRRYTYSRRVVGYMITMDNVPLMVMAATSRNLDSEVVIRSGYVHAVQSYDKLVSPLWLRQGIAEMLSTATYHKNFGMIGKPNKERWEHLYREINYDKIVEDDFDGLKRRMGVDVYAQYWLLCNYSLTHENGKYIDNLGTYLKLYRSGVNSLEAFNQAYGMSPDMFAEEAMSNYRRRSYSYNMLIYPLDFNEMDLDVEMLAAPDGLVERLMQRLSVRIEAKKRDR